MGRRREMGKVQEGWRWEEGKVDQREEYLELSYLDLNAAPEGEPIPLARVAKPIGQVFKVEWLVRADSAALESMLAEARRELDFYLVELDNPDRWAYAKYHCSTASNIYSPVHWLYNQWEG